MKTVENLHQVVNTESGKYLHQFEWTDKISEIPERWIITEGYDDEEENHEHSQCITQEVVVDKRYGHK